MIAEFDWSLLPPLVVAPFIGSFLAVVVTRLPLGEPVVAGRSYCHSCGRQLAILDLVPILSWLVLRGRCRHCQARIDPTHLLLEVIALVVALWSVMTLEGIAVWFGCALGWWLITLAALDLRAGVLPHILTGSLALAGLTFATLEKPPTFTASVLGAVCGYLAFRLVAWGYRTLRGRDGLGGGDAMMLGASGTWVGWSGLPSVVFIASVSGLFAALLSYFVGRDVRSDSRIAFGPHLALGIWIVWLYGPLTLL